MTSDKPLDATRERIEAVYHAEARRVFATLIRLLGDFDRAEDALSDAFMAALQQWPTDGVPANPRAWLVSAGRFKAIDAMRRRARFDASLALLDEQIDADSSDAGEWENEGLADDRLRLIFTCCSPALSPDARVALTLLDQILASVVLAEYHLAHSVQADLYRRLGRNAEARASYERALGLARQEPERRFLERRLGELQAGED